MMKHYDFTYLTRQDMDETGAKALSDKLVAAIQAKQGTITEITRAFKKRLAFRIKHQDVAYVNTILLQLEPAAAVDFKKEADIIPEIIRGLIVFYDPEKLKKEIRRERPTMAAKLATEESTGGEKALAFETKAEETVIENKVEEPKKEAKVETKTEEASEKKPEEGAEEAKEPKAAKPRRKKAKVELRDIEEKLDEILK
jgi:ribosomal protein S6